MGSSSDARKQFGEADALYRARRYPEAIELLEALDAKWPNQRNVLYPLAFSYAAMGRLEDARQLRDRLKEDFLDRREQKLDAFIERCMNADTPEAVRPEPPKEERQELPPTEVLTPKTDDRLHDPLAAFSTSGTKQPLPDAPATPTKPAAVADPLGIDAPAITAPRRAYVEEGDGTLVWKIVLAIAIVFLTVLDISGERMTYESENRALQESVYGEDAVSYMRAVNPLKQIIVVPLQMILFPIPLYIVLKLAYKVPFENFWQNYFSCYGYSLIIFLTSLLCCVGIVWGFYMTAKRCDLDWFACFLMFVFFGIMSALTAGIEWGIIYGLGPMLA